MDKHKAVESFVSVAPKGGLTAVTRHIALTYDGRANYWRVGA